MSSVFGICGKLVTVCTRLTVIDCDKTATEKSLSKAFPNSLGDFILFDFIKPKVKKNGVCPLDTLLSCAKMAEPIWVLFVQ